MQLTPYRGYFAEIIPLEDYLYNKIDKDLQDLVSFESLSDDEIEKEIHDAIDEYIEFCKISKKIKKAGINNECL